MEVDRFKECESDRIYRNSRMAVDDAFAVWPWIGVAIGGVVGGIVWGADGMGLCGFLGYPIATIILGVVLYLTD